jgi:hypothetical protein
MKKIFILCSFLSLVSFAAFAQDKTPRHKYPVIDGNAPRVLKWDTTVIDMGKIPEGRPATVKFNFTNTGTKPITLKDVHPSCSCTTPDYSREIINAGKTGYVMATYNAAQVGKFNKSIAVTTSLGEIDILVIKGEVVSSGSNR